MARVTVEDCIKKVANRFELVVLAASRSKELSYGATPTVQRDDDKNSVLSLREIAQSQEFTDEVKEKYIQSLQKTRMQGMHEEDQEEIDLERDWSEQIAQLSRELESLGSIEEDLGEGMHVEDNDENSEDASEVDEKE